MPWLKNDASERMVMHDVMMFGEDAENIELLRQKVESLEALILQLSQQAAASNEDDESPEASN